MVSGRTHSHLGNCFLIRSIRRSHGALSGHLICLSFLLLTSFLVSFRNFERTVLGAYRWLSDNYEPGDCIFLFGALEQYVTCMSVDAEDLQGFLVAHSKSAYSRQ